MVNKDAFLKKKNILYIVHSYSDFHKDQIDEAAKYFNKVYVIVRYKPISEIIHIMPFKWLEKYEESYVIDMKNTPKNVEVLKSTVWYLPYGFLYKLAGFMHFRAVERVIRKNNIRFDIIHSHFIWTAGYVGMKLKEKYNKPMVITGHGFDVYDLPFQSNFWRKITKKILMSADKIVTVSKKNIESLYKLDIKESEVEVVENGYNSKLFFPIDKNIARKKIGIEDKGNVLVSVGSLERIKGRRYLIGAVALLLKDFKNVRCYIVGGGSREERLKTRIEKLGLEKNVFLIGHRSHEEINYWINAGDIFVMSSLNEGMPIVMLEALGCGRPFIGTNVGGISEVINSNDYGLLTESKNIDKLAYILKKALKTNWNDKKILKYAENFTISKQVEKIADIYMKLLKENG